MGFNDFYIFENGNECPLQASYLWLPYVIFLPSGFFYLSIYLLFFLA